MDTTPEQFAAAVITRLPALADVPWPVKKVIAALQIERFTVSDAVAYMCCMEEVTPGLDEDIALARMDRIRNQVAGRDEHAFVQALARDSESQPRTEVY